MSQSDALRLFVACSVGAYVSHRTLLPRRTAEGPHQVRYGNSGTQKAEVEAVRRVQEIDKREKELQQRENQLQQREKDLQQREQEFQRRVTQTETENQQRSSEVLEREQRVQLREKKVEDTERGCTQRQQELGNQEQEFRRRKQELNNQEQELGRREQELGNQEQELGRRKQQTQQLDQQLSNKEQKLLQLEQELSTREQRLQQREEQVSKRQQEVHELEKEVEVRDGRLQQIGQDLGQREHKLKAEQTQTQSTSLELQQQLNTARQSADALQQREQEVAEKEKELQVQRNDLHHREGALLPREQDVVQQESEVKARALELQTQSSALNQRELELEAKERRIEEQQQVADERANQSHAKQESATLAVAIQKRVIEQDKVAREKLQREFGELEQTNQELKRKFETVEQTVSSAPSQQYICLQCKKPKGESSSLKSRPLHSLANVGNTCFVASMAQLLYAGYSHSQGNYLGKANSTLGACLTALFASDNRQDWEAFLNNFYASLPNFRKHEQDDTARAFEGVSKVEWPNPSGGHVHTVTKINISSPLSGCSKPETQSTSVNNFLTYGGIDDADADLAVEIEEQGKFNKPCGSKCGMRAERSEFYWPEILFVVANGNHGFLHAVSKDFALRDAAGKEVGFTLIGASLHQTDTALVKHGDKWFSCSDNHVSDVASLTTFVNNNSMDIQLLAFKRLQESAS